MVARDEKGPLDALVRWYRAQCDGDWEHEFGVRIATLDNPGWHLQVDLAETPVEGRTMPMRHTDDGQGRWLSASSDGEVFRVTCDPESLVEALAQFQEFVSREA